MQIGIDIGASKIESVILDENGAESFRERIECPKSYIQTVETIKQIVFSLDKKLSLFVLIICFPPSISLAAVTLSLLISRLMHLSMKL